MRERETHCLDVRLEASSEEKIVATLTQRQPVISAPALRVLLWLLGLAVIALFSSVWLFRIPLDSVVLAEVGEQWLLGLSPVVWFAVTGGLAALLLVLIVFGHRLRRAWARRYVQELVYEKGDYRHPPRLTIDGREVPIRQVQGLLLIESIGEWEDLRWTLSLVGEFDDIEIAASCPRHSKLRQLAQALSEALGVELRETTVSGTLE